MRTGLSELLNVASFCKGRDFFSQKVGLMLDLQDNAARSGQQAVRYSGPQADSTTGGRLSWQLYWNAVFVRQGLGSLGERLRRNAVFISR